MVKGVSLIGRWSCIESGRPADDVHRAPVSSTMKTDGSFTDTVGPPYCGVGAHWPMVDGVPVAAAGQVSESAPFGVEVTPLMDAADLPFTQPARVEPVLFRQAAQFSTRRIPQGALCIIDYLRRLLQALGIGRSTTAMRQRSMVKDRGKGILARHLDCGDSLFEILSTFRGEAFAPGLGTVLGQ